jgi:acetylornithine deacetylase/succinyl-diaminopimelate desuccinylase-like protein
MALAAALVAVGKLRIPARPRTTLNVGTIRGGTSVNSIPEMATADLDLRSVSGTELDRMELAVLHNLDAEIRANALDLRVERIGDRAAGGLTANSALYGSLRAVDRHLNLSTDARIGSTDANLPLSLGVQALAIGSGGTGWGIHTLSEGYDPTGREVALKRVLLLLLDACELAAAGAMDA